MKFLIISRETIRDKKNQEHAELFPDFNINSPYIRLQEWNIEDGDDTYVQIRIFSEKYSDIIELDNYYNFIYASDPDPQWDGRWINQQEYEYTYIVVDEELEVIESFYPISEIRLPTNYLEENPSLLSKTYIERQITSYTNQIYKNTQLRTAINRLSAIWPDQLANIINFLDPSCNWKMLGDRKKSEMFHLIFFYLGFEIISLEILIHHPKFSRLLGSKPHPDLIVYSLTRNEIYIIEELHKLDTKFLYKKDTMNFIIELFADFFPNKTNRFYFSYLAKIKSSALTSIPLTMIDQNVFRGALSTLFNNALLSKDFFNRKLGRYAFEKEYENLLKKIFPA